MRVLTFSRHFPKGHPKAGQRTNFVEKVWKCLWDNEFGLEEHWHNYVDVYRDFATKHGFILAKPQDVEPKHHTIRSGNHFKPGDMVSLRVWSDKPYRSRQIEFAQVEVKKTWEFIIHVVNDDLVWQVPGSGSGQFDTKSESLQIIASNDGLEIRDFIDWFIIHPKAKGQVFTGQIICWNENLNY